MLEDFRRCSHCRHYRRLDAFAWRNKAEGKRAPFCRGCQAEYNRKHYLANKDLYVRRAEESKRKARLERTTKLLKFFAEHPCVDCGEMDPLVLEFDHLRDKEFNISTALSCRKWKTVLDEIEKCEVVCANCHRRRTARRRPTVKLLLLEEAGDEDRTRTESLEGSRAAITPRPHGVDNRPV